MKTLLGISIVSILSLSALAGGGGGSNYEKAFECTGSFTEGPKENKTLKVTIFQNMNHFSGTRAAIEIDGVSVKDTSYNVLRLNEVTEPFMGKGNSYNFRSDYEFVLLNGIYVYFSLVVSEQNQPRSAYFSYSEKSLNHTLLTSKAKVTCVGGFKN